MARVFVFVLSVASLLTSTNGASKRPCEPCPNSEYPVCATNGTHWFLFRNGCRLDAENEKREQNEEKILQRTEIANCFQKCDQVCTKEYAPICATWGDNSYTFLNRCELDLENCKEGNIWSILHEGECSSSSSPPTGRPPTGRPPTERPPTRRPPTGRPPTDRPSTGRPSSRPPPPRPRPTQEPDPLPPTTETPEDGCPTFCTMEYAPVCGTTGDREQTFSNMCLFQVEACTSRQNWQIKNEGPCNDSTPMCDETCPKIYSPLCATFNGKRKTFDNECLLDLENCKTESQWDILQKGVCQDLPDDCPTRCTKIYKPLCAVNTYGERRTFSNQCYLEMENCKNNLDWQIESVGECPTRPSTPEPQQKCPEVCPTIYQPVCAAFKSIQQTFPNSCIMEVEICKSGLDWEILYEGECTFPEPPTTSRPRPSSTTPPPQQCNEACPRNYQPICAACNGVQQTFPNRCVMDADICKTGIDWRVLYEGECAFPTPLTTSRPRPSSTTPPPPQCNEACPRNYQPICAACNGLQQTFPNRCVMDADICKTGIDWRVLYEGECAFPTSATSPRPTSSSAPPPPPQCNEACPFSYQPVCAGCNGVQQTFPNRCVMDVDICKTGIDWRILYEGECAFPIPPTSPRPTSSSPPPQCNEACPYNYQPVCAGCNGVQQSFPNRCVMNVDICKTGIDWKILYEGECAQPTPSTTPRPTPSSTPAASQECPEQCPTNYKPVCTVCNGVQQTFPNICIMTIDTCKTGIAWQVIYNGTCALPTTETTSTSPSPVSSTTPPACRDACPAIYSPVCASSMGNIRTFSNGCELSVESCKTGQTWKVLFNGRCEDQYQPGEQERGTSICPAIYDPICAAFQGETKTFSNKCQMDAEISGTNTPWEIVATSECEKLPPETQPSAPCPKCSNYYQPVCGFQQGNQKTFTNECQMLAENCYDNQKWVVVYDGECKVSDQPRNCPNICPLTYNPVCAVYNGVRRTFQNECELNHESYKTGAEWVIVSSGECNFCPTCSNQIDPICAEYNGETKTFDNSCLMDFENCKTGSEWRVIYKNPCTIQICPGFCPNIYKPVCATNSSADSRTFNNECEMKMESCHSDTEWTLKSKGQCPSDNQNCPSECKVEFQPLCATNQKETQSFINECFLKSRNCGSDADTWELLHWGECTVDNVEQPNSPEPVQQNQRPVPQNQPWPSHNQGPPRRPNQPSQPNEPNPAKPKPIQQTHSIQIDGTLQASQVIEISPTDIEALNQILNRLPSDSGISYGPASAAKPKSQQPDENSPASHQTPRQTSSNQPPPSNLPANQQNSSQKPTGRHRCKIVPCVAVYNPVCGTYNGVERTFSNPCSLSNFNCRYSENWQILYNGFCEKSIETQY